MVARAWSSRPLRLVRQVTRAPPGIRRFGVVGQRHDPTSKLVDGAVERLRPGDTLVEEPLRAAGDEQGAGEEEVDLRETRVEAFEAARLSPSAERPAGDPPAPAIRPTYNLYPENALYFCFRGR